MCKSVSFSCSQFQSQSTTLQLAPGRWSEKKNDLRQHANVQASVDAACLGCIAKHDIDIVGNCLGDLIIGLCTKFRASFWVGKCGSVGNLVCERVNVISEKLHCQATSCSHMKGQCLLDWLVHDCGFGSQFDIELVNETLEDPNCSHNVATALEAAITKRLFEKGHVGCDVGRNCQHWWMCHNSFCIS